MPKVEPSSDPPQSRQTTKHPTIKATLIPKFEPSSNPPQSRHTLGEPTPSPSPTPTLRPLAKQLEELSAYIFARPTLYPTALHSSDCPKSRYMFEDPKLPALAEKAEELSARIVSLEKDVHHLYACLTVMSKQREYLEQAHARLWAFIYEENGLLHTLNAMAEENGGVNEKGKETVDIAGATGQKEQKL